MQCQVDDNEDDHSTIGGAIENASEGDTILVMNGTYNETLVINKEIRLVGEDPNGIIVQNTGAYPVITEVLDGLHIGLEQ